MASSRFVSRRRYLSVLVAADAGLDYRVHVRSWAIKSCAAPMPGTVGYDPRRISKLTSLDGKPHKRSEGHRN